MAAQIRHFLLILRELQKIDPEFPLQYAVCLSEIALHEGMSLTALATRTGMPLSTVSRIVGALSRHRQRGRAYDLVQVNIAPTERRRKELYLTTRGHAVINGIRAAILPTPDIYRTDGGHGDKPPAKDPSIRRLQA